SKCGLGFTSVGRMDKHGQTSRSGHQLTQEFQPLCHQLSTEKIYSCQVAARLGEASHQTNPDWIFGDDEDDRNRRGCRLGRRRRSDTPRRGNYRDLPANQFGCQGRQSIELTFGPAVFNSEAHAFDITSLSEALAKSAQTIALSVGRVGVEEPDHWHRRLLRARRERPRSSRAAEQRKEGAAFHSITSSARASSAGGMVRPSALAVGRLITSSSLVGNSTGRSPGLAPFRILTT